jgi:hypothetical protein
MWKRVIGFGGTVLWISIAVVNAQEMPLPRYEVGAQVTGLDLREFSHVLGRRNELALGGRFTVNVNSLLATDAQVDLYPDDKFFDYRRKIQGLFGVKVGVRNSRVGFFGKVRPGFIHVRDRQLCLIPEGCGLTPPGYTDRYLGKFWLALDTGAVFEVYPSQRVVLRLDAGDLLVRRFDGTDASGKRYYSTHNLQIGAGVALRF